jgi:hypothetical protein
VGAGSPSPAHPESLASHRPDSPCLRSRAASKIATGLVYSVRDLTYKPQEGMGRIVVSRAAQDARPQQLACWRTWPALVLRAAWLARVLLP